MQLVRQAARIAINRQAAGLHFPVDTATGAVLGMTVGTYLVQRLAAANTFNAWSFDGSQYTSTWDFDWSQYYDPVNRAQTTVNNGAGNAVVSPIGTNPQQLGDRSLARGRLALATSVAGMDLNAARTFGS